MNFGDRHCGVTYCFVINPRRACVMGTVVVCMCVVCQFSLFYLLALLGVQREVSVATAWKMQ